MKDLTQSRRSTIPLSTFFCILKRLAFTLNALCFVTKGNTHPEVRPIMNQSI